MTNDRELLILAALAAGWNPEWYDGTYWINDCHWDPLNHDGDALRLAVALEIDVLHRRVGGPRVECVAPGVGAICEPCGESRMAATRRAIVRAAAEIGKKEPA